MIRVTEIIEIDEIGETTRKTNINVDKIRNVTQKSDRTEIFFLDGTKMTVTESSGEIQRLIDLK